MREDPDVILVGEMRDHLRTGVRVVAAGAGVPLMDNGLRNYARIASVAVGRRGLAVAGEAAAARATASRARDAWDMAASYPRGRRSPVRRLVISRGGGR